MSLITQNKHINISRIAISLLFIVLMFLVNSPDALAHVKWFIGGAENAPLPSKYYSIFDIEVIIWIAIAIAMLFSATKIEEWLSKQSWSIPPVKRPINLFSRLFGILVGISFLLSAYYSQIVIAAHYSTTSYPMMLLQHYQALVGIMLILNIFPMLAAVSLIIIYVSLAMIFGVTEVLDYVNILGVALFILLDRSGVEKIREYAIPVLRILAGIALVTLGISEKLLQPELGFAFLSLYDWNFMPALGFSFFSNELFVLSAGVMEVIIGTILILGVVTRINTIVVASLMIITNTTFALQMRYDLAITELIGHLPFVATAIMLVVHGSGTKLKFAFNRKIFAVGLKKRFTQLAPSKIEFNQIIQGKANNLFQHSAMFIGILPLILFSLPSAFLDRENGLDNYLGAGKKITTLASVNDCLADNSICKTELSDDKNLIFTIVSPKGPLINEFTIAVGANGEEISDVVVDIKGLSHEHIPNLVKFRKMSNGTYQGSGFLDYCGITTMNWSADVFLTIDGIAYRATYFFDSYAIDDVNDTAETIGITETL